MARVNIGPVDVRQQDGPTALVFAELTYSMFDGTVLPDSKPNILLVFDRATGSWLFDDKW